MNLLFIDEELEELDFYEIISFKKRLRCNKCRFMTRDTITLPNCIMMHTRFPLRQSGLNKAISDVITSFLTYINFVITDKQNY